MEKKINKKILIAVGGVLFITLIIISGFFVLYEEERKEELKGEAKIQLSYRMRIQNTGPLNLTLLTLRLALIKDWDPVQTVQSIKPLTAPNRTSTDIYDNQFIWYEFENFKVGQSLDLQINVNMTLNFLDYSGIDFGSRAKTDYYDTNSNEYKLFTAFNPLYDTTDPAMQSQAAKLTDSNDIKEIAFQAYNFSSTYIRYRLLGEEKGSSFALRNGYGDCNEYSNLFTALVRSRGIPSVDHTAWLADFETGMVTTDEGAAAHAYPMFLVPGMGLLPVDPTRGNTNLFDNWLKTDEKRITMTRGPNNAYRLLRYRWVPVDGIKDPLVVSNYTISIQNLDIEYFSNLRFAIIGLLIAIPVIFVSYNVVVGRKIRKINQEKRIKILSLPNQENL